MNCTQKKKRSIIDSRYRLGYRRLMRGVRKDIRVGDVVEGCDLHLGIVLEVDPYNGDVKSQSIFTGKVGYCDLYHCGVVKQTTKQIIQKMNLYNQGGMDSIKNLWYDRVAKGVY